MSVASILAGTSVEVASVERQDDGDLLVGLITTPPTWVYVRAGDAADELRALWARRAQRITIPMPPRDVLMAENPAASAQQETG